MYPTAQNFTNQYSSVNGGYAAYAPPVPSAPPAPIYPQQAYAAPQPQLIAVHVLTPQVHYETESLLAKATELADSISGRVTHYVVQNRPAPVVQPQQAPHYSPPIIPVICHMGSRGGGGFRMFSNETHVHHHYDNSGQSGEKDEKNARLLVGLLGLIAALTTIFFAGKAVAEKEELDDTVSTYQTLEGKWTQNKHSYDCTAQAYINRIVENVDKILERKQTNKTHKIALLAFGFVSSGVAFVGAVIAVKGLMVIGIVGGGAAGAVALYKLGYACFSNREAKEAEAINADVRGLRTTQHFI